MGFSLGIWWFQMLPNDSFNSHQVPNDYLLCFQFVLEVSNKCTLFPVCFSQSTIVNYILQLTKKRRLHNVYFESIISLLITFPGLGHVKRFHFRRDYQLWVLFWGWRTNQRGPLLKEKKCLHKPPNYLIPIIQYTHDIQYMKRRASKQSNFWISEFCPLEAGQSQQYFSCWNCIQNILNFTCPSTNKQTNKRT